MTPLTTPGPQGRFRTTLTALIFAVSTATACGDDPVTPNPNLLEALPTTAATVTAAVELVTKSPMVVPARCHSDPLINCANGTAGAPVSVAIVRGPIAVAPMTATEFSFGTDLKVTSLQNIPVSSSGVSCSASVHTAEGASQTVRFAGVARFQRWSASEDINAVVLEAEVTGLESGDVTLSGSALCAAASSMESLVRDALADALAGNVALCGASGAALFRECPSIGPDLSN